MTLKGSSSGEYAGLRPLQFIGDKTFQVELRRRVDEHFQSTGRERYGDWRVHLKTAVVLAFFATTYFLLVFVAHTIWEGLLLAVLLGVAVAGIGFNIMHDAGHKAYSGSRWVNRIMAMTMDLVGGSSYLWRWKHAVIHHRYVNITGYDTDIDIGFLGRLSPHQKRLWFHRWQHFYLWLLYGFLAIKWQLVDDFVNIAKGRYGAHRIPRPKGWDLVSLVLGKTIFVIWAFIVPMQFHSVWVVLFYYCVVVAVLGFLMSVVFQLPHCVGEAEFPLPEPDTPHMRNSWAVHQAHVTLDFSRHSQLLTWLLGGLNYHLEHHLFPGICHVHYPAISGVVEETCREFGVQYARHRSFTAGVVSHYRWLRRMGMPDTPE